MSRAESEFLSNRLYEPMNATANVFDVSSDAFVEQVINASRDTAVMVDFWAQWCGPCRALTPILMRLVDEFAGQFRLAKVDTEAEPRLAADHGIRSLPTVKLFRNAVVVAEFSGLQPESFIRSMLEEHLPRASDAECDRAEVLAGSGEVGAAIAVLQAAAASDPSNHRVHVDLAVLLWPTSKSTRRSSSCASCRPTGNKSRKSRPCAQDCNSRVSLATPHRSPS